MDEFLTIGEVSRLLDIPESTLRYWQEKGIYEIPQGDNNYRMYTVQHIVKIAEVAFYRNIGLPIRAMKQFQNLSLKDFQEIFTTVKCDLKKQLEHYDKMYTGICRKISHVEQILQLQRVDYTYDTVPFSIVVRFDYNDRDKLLAYTRDPTLYVRLLHTDVPELDVRGIVVEEAAPTDRILWQKCSKRDFAVFLVTEYPDEDYRNNINEKLELIRKKHKTGILLARYLMHETAEDKVIDYLVAYVELR